MTPVILLAAEKESAEVTDWAARIGWVVGLALFVALVYWLMREGWKWRGTLQSDLPALSTRPSPTTTLNGDGKPPLSGMPDEPGEARLGMSGRYHGSTTAGQWLDRIVAHGLGTRSRVELTLTDAGLDVVRPGATDFFVPVEALREARLDKGIAGARSLPRAGCWSSPGSTAAGCWTPDSAPTARPSTTSGSRP